MSRIQTLLLCFFAGFSLLYAQSVDADSLRWKHRVGKKAQQDSLFRRGETQLSELQISTRALRRVNNSAFNAVAIDLERLQSRTLDVAGALDKIAGIKIRYTGGVGSTTNINLNGFSGRHVRLFVDGVPMQGAASSFSLANIPAALAQSVEVYKGVVPVELGGDALGGAVNIVTRRTKGTLLDAAYSLGAYNSHKANVLLSHQWRNGFGLRWQSYLNYSDNDYKVWVKNLDLRTLAWDKEENWYKRFHDKYRSEALMLQWGWTDKPWADRLLFGLDYTQERADIQTANLMQIVFGQKHRHARGWTPRLTYAKQNFFVPALDLNLSLRHDHTISTLIDTATADYNWRGERLEKETRGEGWLQEQAIHAQTTVGVLGLKYRWNKHFLAFNHTLSHFTRRTEELSVLRKTLSAADHMRRTNLKNVAGVEYKYVPSYHWTFLLMGKFYDSQVRGPVEVAPLGRRPYYEEQQRSSQTWGYGAALTYRPNNIWQLKSSYERAVRLPTLRELFGDGDYEVGAAALRPEQSHNLNFNFSFDQRWHRHHDVRLELGSTLRQVSDYIIRDINTKGAAVSRNFGKVSAWGLDLSGQYNYKRCLEISFAYAYLSLRNAEKLTPSGARSVNYQERVPNVPFSHGNVEMNYSFLPWHGRDARLTVGYGLDYIHRFYRTWVGDGAKLYIPTQVSHSVSVTLGLLKNNLSLALEAHNLWNEKLYDNYSLQKPGRNVMAKLRYVFRK